MAAQLFAGQGIEDAKSFLRRSFRSAGDRVRSAAAGICCVSPSGSRRSAIVAARNAIMWDPCPLYGIGDHMVAAGPHRENDVHSGVPLRRFHPRLVGRFL
ncbi:hypothetical protein HH310_06780 [Actinoplanes sp. TBRC 11911]|uniref:hypothetical protein n=1 Tax=Actinoplanes sp. TBRC 11911 TaxID=2729386 RepID=UPI00145EF2A1|nr:hypothetical protein [Actinoplanes sp. TBRC 11911]NMO50897.1 hypothetical protein [Actinoplanes sp. TBRC 11911]